MLYPLSYGGRPPGAETEENVQQNLLAVGILARPV